MHRLGRPQPPLGPQASYSLLLALALAFPLPWPGPLAGAASAAISAAEKPYSVSTWTVCSPTCGLGPTRACETAGVRDSWHHGLPPPPPPTFRCTVAGTLALACTVPPARRRSAAERSYAWRRRRLGPVLMAGDHDVARACMLVFVQLTGLQDGRDARIRAVKDLPARGPPVVTPRPHIVRTVPSAPHRAPRAGPALATKGRRTRSHAARGLDAKRAANLAFISGHLSWSIWCGKSLASRPRPLRSSA